MKSNKFKYFFVLILVALFATSNVSAADFRKADKTSGNIQVGQSETFKNLYTVGNIVSVDSNIQKVLYVAGNVVTVNGAVGEGIYSGAGTFMVNGNVGGSVHAGGSTVIVNGRIADDLFAAGNAVSVSKSAFVGGDLFIGGTTVDVQGPVLGDVHIGAKNVNIDNEIHGNVKIYSSDKITLGANAKIDGNLEYDSKNPMVITAGATVIGQTIVNSKKAAEAPKVDKNMLMAIIFAIISVSILVKVVGLILVGLVLIYMCKNFTEKVAEESLNNFWKNLGTGFIAMIVVPIVMVLLFVSIVGIWLGIFVGLLYVLSILFAVAMSGIIFGKWLFGVIKKDKNHHIDWKVVVCGIILLQILKFIPIIGWLLCAIFMLISLGATYQHVYESRKS